MKQYLEISLQACGLQMTEDDGVDICTRESWQLAG